MKWRHCQTVALWSAYCHCDDNFLVIFLSTNFRRWRIAGSYSHQVVNLVSETFRFWDIFAFSCCGWPLALAFPSSVFNSFPLLTMSPLLLQFLPSSCEKPRSFNLYYNQRLSHGIVSACWRLPAKAFATKNNTTTQPPRTIQPHYGTTKQPPRTLLWCKPTKQQDIHTLAQNIQPTILPHYSHYQLELTLPTM